MALSEKLDKLMSSLNDEEQLAVQQILAEISVTGKSKRLDNLYEKDFVEVPVDIDTFIESDEYAGWFTGNGKNIFPYWREKFREIFDERLNYSEIVLGGSIGCGKTTIAVIALAYTLYWTMCLRDPNPYYGLGRGDAIYIVFFNCTLQLSRGVGYQKFQDLLQHSPWFMARGTVSGTKYLEYTPNKTENATIKFVVGSQPEHALGRAVLCLTGDTRIYTDLGVRTLKDLDGKYVRVLTKYDDGSIRFTDTPVQILQTGVVTDLLELELEDGTVLKCTEDHQFRLTNGNYITAKDLTEDSDIDVGCCETSGIYAITNLLNGKKYIGKSESNVLLRLKHHRNGVKSNKHLQDAILKYGIENFRFEVLEFCDPSECGDRERYWIDYYDTFENGYNYTTGGEGKSGWHLHPEAIEKTAKVHRGKIVSQHTRDLLSKAHKGKTISEEIKQKYSEMYSGMGNPFYGKHHTDETIKMLQTSHKRENLSKDTLDKMSKQATERNIGKFWINDGNTNKFVTVSQFDELDQTVWKLGRLLDNSSKLGKVFMHLGKTNIQISKDQQEVYLALGWELGMYKRSGWKKHASKKNNKSEK